MYEHFIEVTQLTPVATGPQHRRKLIVGRNHIVLISPAGQDSRSIKFVTGDTIAVAETYEELKALLEGRIR